MHNQYYVTIEREREGRVVGTCEKDGAPLTGMDRGTIEFLTAEANWRLFNMNEQVEVRAETAVGCMGFMGCMGVRGYMGFMGVWELEGVWGLWGLWGVWELGGVWGLWELGGVWGGRIFKEVCGFKGAV